MTAEEAPPSASLPLDRSLTLKIALALVVAKIAWTVVMLQAGGLDLRSASNDVLLRFVTTIIGAPVHLVLAIFVWRRKKWAAYTLLVIAVAGALGAGGTGLFFGLPHALDGNYDRDTDMIPFVSVAIVINVVLAISLWVARHDSSFAKPQRVTHQKA